MYLFVVFMQDAPNNMELVGAITEGSYGGNAQGTASSQELTSLKSLHRNDDKCVAWDSLDAYSSLKSVSMFFSRHAKAVSGSPSIAFLDNSRRKDKLKMKLGFSVKYDYRDNTIYINPNIWKKNNYTEVLSSKISSYSSYYAIYRNTNAGLIAREYFRYILRNHYSGSDSALSKVFSSVKKVRSIAKIGAPEVDALVQGAGARFFELAFRASEEFDMLDAAYGIMSRMSMHPVSNLTMVRAIAMGKEKTKSFEDFRNYFTRLHRMRRTEAEEILATLAFIESDLDISQTIKTFLRPPEEAFKRIYYLAVAKSDRVSELAERILEHRHNQSRDIYSAEFRRLTEEEFDYMHKFVRLHLHSKKQY